MNNDVIANAGIIVLENPEQVDSFKQKLQETGTPYKQNQNTAFLLFNTTVADLSFWGRTYLQKSFVFGTFFDEADKVKIKWDFYERNKPEKVRSPFVCKESKITDFDTNAFAVNFRDFKADIPFSLFEDFCHNIDRKVRYRKSNSADYAKDYEYHKKRMLDETLTFKSRMTARAHLYGNYWTPLEGRDETLRKEKNALKEEYDEQD